MSVAVVAAVTADAVAVKLAVVDPAATVTVLGVVTDELLSEMVTTAPPAGADPVNATVHVVLPAPVIVPGEQLNDDSVTVPASAANVSAALAVLLPYVPVNATVVVVATADAVAVKLAVVDPAATVTIVGTVTDELPDDSVTAAPPAGAAPDNLTVQVALPAPVIVVGVQLNDDNVTLAVDPVRSSHHVLGSVTWYTSGADPSLRQFAPNQILDPARSNCAFGCS